MDFVRGQLAKISFFAGCWQISISHLLLSFFEILLSLIVVLLKLDVFKVMLEQIEVSGLPDLELIQMMDRGCWKAQAWQKEIKQKNS